MLMTLTPIASAPTVTVARAPNRETAELKAGINAAPTRNKAELRKNLLEVIGRHHKSIKDHEKYLRKGDQLFLWAEGLGFQRNRIVPDAVVGGTEASRTATEVQ